MPVPFCTYQYDAEQAKVSTTMSMQACFQPALGLYMLGYIVLLYMLVAKLTQALSKRVQITHKLVTSFILYCITSLFKSFKLGKLVRYESKESFK